MSSYKLKSNSENTILVAKFTDEYSMLIWKSMCMKILCVSTAKYVTLALEFI